MGDASLELVYAHPELADLEPVARRVAIEELLRSAGVGDADQAAERVALSIDGYGPLTPFLEDPTITDVLVNGTREVWVERAGALERTELSIASDELDALVDRLVGRGGGRIDTLHPVTDVRLDNGARMHVVCPPVAPDGPIVSIRCFGTARPTVGDLVSAGTVSKMQAETLVELVHERASIAISGATGVGKTTLLGALLAKVPCEERIVVIEETPELGSRHPHAVHLRPRAANVEGRGAVTAAELVRAALRMRPDRIVVGEARGAEAAEALWAMSTGHRGSMLTVHARGPRAVPGALAGLAARSASEVADLAGRFAEAIDAVVHLERVATKRVVTGFFIR